MEAATIEVVRIRQSRRAGRLLPERAVVKIDDPALPYVVELTVTFDGDAVVCERLTAETRDGGPPMRSQELRKLPVPELLRRAAGECWFESLALPEMRDGDAPTLSGYVRSRGGDTSTQAQRSRRDPELYERFVVLLRECKLSATPYLPRAKAKLHLPERTAIRWKKKAERAGDA